MSQENIIVFDVDGVLLDNKAGGFKEVLGKYFNKQKEVDEINEKYQRRKHLGPWGLEQLTELYKGLEVEKVAEVTKNYVVEKLMLGAKEIVGYFKNKNYLVVAISSNPIFILEELKKILGVDLIFGNILEVEGNKYTGKLLEKVDRYIKKEILQSILKKYNITGDIIVIGDSITDLPISELATKFVVFNTDKEEVISKADYVVREKDLTKISKLNI
ncbi:MAG: HAD family phosphatase [Patescibacteria group bacterium]